MTSFLMIVGVASTTCQPVQPGTTESTAIRAVVALVVLAGAWLPYQLMPMTRWGQRVFRWIVVLAVLAFGASNLVAAAQGFGAQLALHAIR